MIVEYFLEWAETAPVSKRIAASSALVRAFLNPELSEEEREETEAALTTLLEDPSPRVRLALAEGFGGWPTAPRHIITALGRDNIDIATVVLSRSPVFHDCELVDIAASGEMAQQIAIACRPGLSNALTAAICEVACEEACLGLIMNPATVLTTRNLHRLAERHGTVTEIRNLLLGQANLPPETHLLLINKLGEALNLLVSKRSWMPASRADNAIRDACERASISFAANAADQDVDRVVKSLIESGSMTASYLLRAVCMGNITLVAKAFSELSGVPFARVESILSNDRQAAFKAVYDRAGLPGSAFYVFQCAISTWRRLLSSGSPINQSRLPFLVTREILQSYSGTQDDVVDELLILLRKLAAETARESARSKAVEMMDRSKQVLLLDDNRSTVDGLAEGDFESFDMDDACLEVFEEFFMDELNSETDPLEAQDIAKAA